MHEPIAASYNKILEFGATKVRYLIPLKLKVNSDDNLSNSQPDEYHVSSFAAAM